MSRRRRPPGFPAPPPEGRLLYRAELSFGMLDDVLEQFGSMPAALRGLPLGADNADAVRDALGFAARALARTVVPLPLLPPPGAPIYPDDAIRLVGRARSLVMAHLSGGD